MYNFCKKTTLSDKSLTDSDRPSAIKSPKPSLLVQDGVVFTYDGSGLICYSKSKKNSTYSIPDHVTRVCKDAFGSNVHLCYLIMHENIESVDKSALANLPNLRFISAPQNARFWNLELPPGCCIFYIE